MGILNATPDSFRRVYLVFCCALWASRILFTSRRTREVFVPPNDWLPPSPRQRRGAAPVRSLRGGGRGANGGGRGGHHRRRRTGADSHSSLSFVSVCAAMVLTFLPLAPRAAQLTRSPARACAVHTAGRGAPFSRAGAGACRACARSAEGAVQGRRRPTYQHRYFPQQGAFCLQTPFDAVVPMTNPLQVSRGPISDGARGKVSTTVLSGSGGERGCPSGSGHCQRCVRGLP